MPSFNIGLSNNPLSDTNVTEMVYGSSSNTAYALDTLLAQGTLAPGETLSMNAAYGLDTPYSLTEVYKISFAAGGGTVNATILEKANSVPEPGVLVPAGHGFGRPRPGAPAPQGLTQARSRLVGRAKALLSL